MRRIYELFRKAMGEDPFVRFYFQRYKRRHPKFHKYCKAASAVYALWLVFLFRLLGRDPRTRLVYPESSVCAHPSRKKMDRVLKKKDFVCFDGELLLLRHVSHIEKLWDAAGAKLGIADYKSMRRAAAAEADKKRKEGKACLAEVCKIVSEWSGADAKQLLRAEQELEENPRARSAKLRIGATGFLVKRYIPAQSAADYGKRSQTNYRERGSSAYLRGNAVLPRGRRG